MENNSSRESREMRGDGLLAQPLRGTPEGPRHSASLRSWVCRQAANQPPGQRPPKGGQPPL